MLTCLPPLVTEPDAEATVPEPGAGESLAERGPITEVTVQGQVGPAPLRTAEIPVGEVAGSVAVGVGVVREPSRSPDKELPPPPPPEEAAEEVQTARERSKDLEEVEREVEAAIAAAVARRAVRTRGKGA